MFIATDFYHSCGIKQADSTVACWGCYNDGLDECKPPSGVEFVSVGVGYWHSCGLQPNGIVECWCGSSGNYGQCETDSQVYLSKNFQDKKIKLPAHNVDFAVSKKHCVAQF